MTSDVFSYPNYFPRYKPLGSVTKGNHRVKACTRSGRFRGFLRSSLPLTVDRSRKLRLRKLERAGCREASGCHRGPAGRRFAVGARRRHREAGKRAERFIAASSFRAIRVVGISNGGAGRDGRRWKSILAAGADEHERGAISRRAEPASRAGRLGSDAASRSSLRAGTPTVTSPLPVRP